MTGDYSQPNILVLLTDQERYNMSAEGEPQVNTENMDRLRSEGMQFTKTYTPIGICSSARASLMTGLYPHNHGMLNNCHESDAVRENLPEKYTTFSELLADEGYYNSYIGKWHVGRDQSPEDFGFNYFYDGDEEHVRPEGGWEETVYTNAVEPELISAKTTLDKEDTRVYQLAERTINRLEAIANGEEGAGKPFFHRTDFVGPHHPYVVPEPYASRYDPDEIEPWPAFNMDVEELLEDKPRVHEQFLEYRGVKDFTWDDWKGSVAKYFGFVDFIDDQIGRILDKVDELGLAEDTVVVHTADHGDFTGSYRQFNKGPIMREETYHIPLQVRWPGVVEEGTTCDEYVRLLDLMPTFTEIGGGDVPDDIDGRSIVPLLHGETPDDWPQSVYTEYHGDEFTFYTQRMVKTDDYTFVFNGPDINELYHTAADPYQFENMIDEMDADVRQEMEKLLLDWMDTTNDPRREWAANALQYASMEEVSVDTVSEPVETTPAQETD